MCLSIAIDRPADVLAHGEHLGYEWMVIHNGMGHRCGYVKVPPGHPWHGGNYNDIGADVHGGLTFAEADVPCGKGGADDGYWLGFDCAHSFDAPDPALPVAPVYADVMAKVRVFSPSLSSVRTHEYVEAECRSLCEQAAAAAS